MTNRRSHGSRSPVRPAAIFTSVVTVLAVIFALMWLSVSGAAALKVFVAVLIVACPCALALSAPYCFGFASRFLNRHGLYLKDSSVIESMARVNSLVFDKTGTLSAKNSRLIDFDGTMNDEERSWVGALCSHSLHPVSQQIAAMIGQTDVKMNSFAEIISQGLIGECDGHQLKIGSASFCQIKTQSVNKGTWVVIDNEVKGCYIFRPWYRLGLEKLFRKLKRSYSMQILSGDNDRGKAIS